MESSGSTDDEEDYYTLLYSIVHHSVEGLPEERNVHVHPGSSPKIGTLYHRIDTSVSLQPTTSYYKVKEHKVCHSGTVQSHAGDVDILPYNEKTSTLTTEVKSRSTECLVKSKKSSEEQRVVDVVTIESSDTECGSVVEVPESSDSHIQPHYDETDKLWINIRNKRRFQHMNMGKKGLGQECIINIEDSDSEDQSALEVQSVPAVSVGSRVPDHSTKGTEPKTKKRKKKVKGAKKTCNNREDVSEYISPKSWTPQMQHFYGDSWGGEDFDVSELQKTMSDNPADWRVLDIDFDPHPRSTFSSRRRKCNNCNSWGHAVTYCPHPKKPTVCIFCGMGGHNDRQCPSSMCLNCGRPSNIYRESCHRCMITIPCSNCNKVGHLRSTCPDIWRTYHSVTSSEGLTAAVSETLYKPRKDQWCPNCAQRGHQFGECPLIVKKFYTLLKQSRKQLKRKLVFPEKKKKRKRKAVLNSFVPTILL